MFTYTSLVPLENADSSRTRSSLLTFENRIHILADPGWDTVTDLTHFESIINSIDIILLSQPTMEFIGAFAYLYKKHTATMRKIKIFSTSPVSNLGRVETIESYRACGLVGPVLTYQMEINDIEEAFDSIVTIKHNQSVIYRKDEDEEQEGRVSSESLNLTALNSGHTLGGIIWHLNMNSDKVVYSPAWNHSRDSYLDGAKILQENGTATAILARPSIIITSSKVGSSIPYPSRVAKFLKLVDATLQNSGTVLLPVSLGSRFLELVHLIDDHLRSSPYQVYLVAKTGTRALTYAGSMLEWMSPVATKGWQSRGKVPFTASTVTMINPEELEVLKGSKIVFCTGNSFEEGSPSFESFRYLCNDPTTTILLTEKTKKGTLAHDLYLYWEKMAKLRNQGKAEDGVPVPYQSSLQVKYIYEENVDRQTLTEFTELVKNRREADKKLKEELQNSSKQVNYNNLTAEEQMLLTIDKKEKILDNDEENDDDEEEEEEDDDDTDRKKDQNDEKVKQKETKEILNENLPLDINARLMKGTNRMFPYIPMSSKFDDYGEIINAKDFARKDPRYELFNNVHNKNSKVGEKRGFEKDMVYSKRKKIEKETKKADEMVDFDPMIHPKKRCERQISLFTKCALSYVDLASLVDLRSFCLLIPLLKPKKVILLDDLSDESASKLVLDSLNSINLRNRAGVIASNGAKQQLFDITQASNNHEIQFSEKTSSLDVFLDEEIIRSIKWQQITGGVRIAQIVGNIVRKKDVDSENEEEKANGVDLEMSTEADGSDVRDLSNLLKVDEMRSTGIGLKGIDEEALKNMNIRSTELSIGDIKLTELKNSFTEYRAEFKGEGMLVIDDKICVKKINEGDFVVEGTPSKLFYEVRAKIKSMLAFV